MKICVLFGGHFERIEIIIERISIANANHKSKQHTYTPPHTKSKRGKFKRK